MIHPQPTITLVRVFESPRRPRYGDDAALIRRSPSATVSLVGVARTLARRRGMRALARPLERY